MYSTAVAEGEMLTEIHIPLGARAAYEKFVHPASRYALAGVAVSLDNGSLQAAYTGAGEKATRITKLETEGVTSACQNLVSSRELIGDAFASTEYRAHLIDVMAARTLARVTA